ncbi:MAG: hypothetical protein ABW137_07695 [Mycobacterium sp.]
MERNWISRAIASMRRQARDFRDASLLARRFDDGWYPHADSDRIRQELAAIRPRLEGQSTR